MSTSAAIPDPAARPAYLRQEDIKEAVFQASSQVRSILVNFEPCVRQMALRELVSEIGPRKKEELRILSTEEAAEILGRDPATLRGWRAKRKGPKFVQLSQRAVGYREEDVRSYVNERVRTPAPRRAGNFG